jgi:hypothetical protein
VGKARAKREREREREGGREGGRRQRASGRIYSFILFKTECLLVRMSRQGGTTGGKML